MSGPAATSSSAGEAQGNSSSSQGQQQQQAYSTSGQPIRFPFVSHLDWCGSQNEEDIAAVLKEQGISRQDVFITSKVSPYEQGTEKAMLACQQILQRLQTDYVVSRAAGRWFLCKQQQILLISAAEQQQQRHLQCRFLKYMCQRILQRLLKNAGMSQAAAKRRTRKLWQRNSVM
jgi:hypothetical protein